MAEPISNKLLFVAPKLIRELALGEQSQSQLADKYDVSPSAITQFKKRNFDAIEAIRKDANDEFAGILIVQKAHRLGLLEQLIREALTPQPKVSASGRVAYVEKDDGTQEMVEEIALDSAARMIKQVAEELGHLPNRVTLAGSVDVTTTYTVEGVSPDDLA